MNRFLRNRLLELLKAIVFLALGSYLGALYATHELLPANRHIDRSVRNGDSNQRSTAFLTVFVVSAPDNNEKRDILRRTWQSSQKHKLKKGLDFKITSCFSNSASSYPGALRRNASSGLLSARRSFLEM
jgi:hypothetical protein